MAEITNEQIKHLAELSELSLSEEETQSMKKELGDILGFVDKINNCKLNVFDFNEDFVSLKDLREDEPQESLSQEEALSNAPKKENGYYVVSKVVD